MLNTPVGQRIGMLISRVAVMPTHPVPVNLVPGPVGQGVQALPEVCVFNLLLGRRAPVARFPSRQPFCDAFEHILAVDMKVDMAGPLEG